MKNKKLNQLLTRGASLLCCAVLVGNTFILSDSTSATTENMIPQTRYIESPCDEYVPQSDSIPFDEDTE